MPYVVEVIYIVNLELHHWNVSYKIDFILMVWTKLNGG